MTLDYRFNRSLRARIEENLGGASRSLDVAPWFRRAAVCIVLGRGTADEADFLLTKRALTLRAHPGQWAFPGGTVHEGESPLDAGLRELHEEVGMELTPSALFGRLDDHRVASGFIITPLVFWHQGGWQLDPDPREVASVHRFPLRTLEEAAEPNFIPRPDGGRILQFEMAGARIHAPTGAILYELKELALHGRHVDLSDVRSPEWLATDFTPPAE